MQSKVFLLSIATSLTSAAIFGNSDFAGISAGKPFEIKWLDASGPVVINLKNGPSTALKDVATIGSGLTGTSFSWTPSGGLSDGTYALEIVDASGINYSGQFPVSGSTGASDTSSNTSAASTRSMTRSPSATTPRSSGTASPTVTSSSEETETSASATLSTAVSLTRNSTMTGMSSASTTDQRSTSTGSRSTRTASSASSSPTSFKSDNSATKGSSFVGTTISTISGLMMFMAAVL